ncbi:hypothetical protein GPECTOR_1g704 [Gonium pectorale]|uniref:Uncharacterized protein n=1 Tax=Gonium pectorale TaxID=33097 RepID=A0A150H400_GONPE|nr:hypothetical protein GPECTOR_1g704 [Gonium pectorale]|eukprot:KXZ56782.1 hypothetical protein GPECTOR_1g704 [Gonium pectorale]
MRAADGSTKSLADGSGGLESNLGQLGRFAYQGGDDTPYLPQRVDPSSFSSQGLYIDGAALFASGALLLLLLAFSTNRIFGLERFFMAAMR